MALIVNDVSNTTDFELIVKNNDNEIVKRIPPNSIGKDINESLFNLTFISETTDPVFIKIVENVDESNGDDLVDVEAGKPEDEIDS